MSMKGYRFFLSPISSVVDGNPYVYRRPNTERYFVGVKDAGAYSVETEIPKRIYEAILNATWLTYSIGKHEERNNELNRIFDGLTDERE